MSDDEADPELLELLRQTLGIGQKKSNEITSNTGVLKDAEYIYSNAIDVSIDMYGTKSAAIEIYNSMQQKSYSTETWMEHELHPRPSEGFSENDIVNFIFTMDLLNYSFWSDLSSEDRFQVEYRGKRWTGYNSLIACLRRALDGDIPITTPRYWRSADFTDATAKAVFRSATTEQMPLLEDRIASLREASKVLCDLFPHENDNDDVGSEASSTNGLLDEGSEYTESLHMDIDGRDDMREPRRGNAGAATTHLTQTKAGSNPLQLPFQELSLSSHEDGSVAQRMRSDIDGSAQHIAAESSGEDTTATARQAIPNDRAEIVSGSGEQSEALLGSTSQNYQSTLAMGQQNTNNEDSSPDTQDAVPPVTAPAANDHLALQSDTTQLPGSRTRSQRPDHAVARLIQQADKSAGKLVNLLALHFPSFRDETRFDGRKVRLLKRAQIFVADSWAALNGTELGDFHDIDHLTIFADYRVPQVLHSLGVLTYSPPLGYRIQNLGRIEFGHSWEVQIRGCSIWAVELIKREILKAHPDANVNAVLIDFFLYDLAKEREAQAVPTIPHHRTRSVWY